MILDILDNADRYKTLHKGFAKAFEFLKRTDLATLTEGRYDIDGDTIFAIVAKDQGREKDAAQLEIHNKYIDIQMVLEGVDEMGWKARSTCTDMVDTYDPDNDIQFITDAPTSWATTETGHFTIFFPEDAHLPLIAQGLIHKVVVKVAV